MGKKIGGIKGSVYGKIKKDKKDLIPKTEAGRFLLNLKRKPSEYPRFKLSPNKTLIRIHPPTESKIKSLVYPLIRPYAYANIYLDEKDNTLVYNLVEPRLTEYEEKILERVKEGLVQVIDVRLEDIKNVENVIEFLENHVQMLLEEYNLKLNEKEYIKILYYVYRDFVGFNNIEPLLRDPYIEDIGCLTDDENIFVKIDGNTMLTTIGSLVDSEIGKGEFTNIGKPSKSIQAVSFNPKTLKAEFKDITGLLRKKNVHGHYLDIKTEGGNHVKVSPDHPMLVLDRSGITVRRADSVKENDFVLRLKNIGYEATAADIDLIGEFSRTKNNFRVRGAKAIIKNNMDASRKLGVSNRLVALWKQSDSMPLWAYLMLEENKDMRKRLRITAGQGSKTSIPAVIHPDEDLAIFLGLFLAEGYYEASGISFAFGKHEKELHKFTAELGRKLFGTTTRVIEHKTSTVVYCGGNVLRSFFEAVLKAGNNSYNKRIPDAVY